MIANPVLSRGPRILVSRMLNERRSLVHGAAHIVIMVVIAANAFLVFSAMDGKRVIREAEAKAGRALSGYELHTEHREVNDYYYQHPGGRSLRGDVLYNAATPLIVPWIIVSFLVAILPILLFRQRLHTASWVPGTVIAILFGMMIAHWPYVAKVAWAVE